MGNGEINKTVDILLLQANLPDPELYQWYGSAALPLFLKYHDAIKKKDF